VSLNPSRADAPREPHSHARAGAIEWRWYAFDSLSPASLYAVLAARSAVFVVEQRCAYQDLDGYDAKARHLVAWQADDVAAYCRTFAPGVKYAEASIGRVLTTQDFRATGIGRALIERAIEGIDVAHGSPAIRISAQSYLERFYASFGFVTVSEPYLEDGIPHVEMVRAGGAA
jgi:ElaA protein